MQWAYIPSAPIAPRARHQGISVGERLVVWGGVGGRRSAADFRDGAVYDRAAGFWRVAGETPLEPRVAAAITTADNRVFVFGGLLQRARPLPMPAADAMVLDLESFRWETIPSMPLRPRANHKSFWTGERIIVWGGDEGVWLDGVGANCMNDGAAYDPKTRGWEKIAPCPLAPRCFPHVVWDGTRMIVWGGSERYSPGRPRRSHEAAVALRNRDDRMRRSVQHANEEAGNLDATLRSAGAVYDSRTDSWNEFTTPSVTAQPGWSFWVGEEVAQVTVSGAVLKWRVGDKAVGEIENSRIPSAFLLTPTTSVSVAEDLLVIIAADPKRASRVAGFAYHVPTGEITELPSGPINPRLEAVTTSGAAIMIWGGIALGTEGTEPRFESDGAVLTVA